MWVWELGGNASIQESRWGGGMMMRNSPTNRNWETRASSSTDNFLGSSGMFVRYLSDIAVLAHLQSIRENWDRYFCSSASVGVGMVGMITHTAAPRLTLPK